MKLTVEQVQRCLSNAILPLSYVQRVTDEINVLIAQEIEKAPVVYGYTMGGAFDWSEEANSDLVYKDTHTARLIDIREIK